jgi:hypothetical protein
VTLLAGTCTPHDSIYQAEVAQLYLGLQRLPGGSQGVTKTEEP